MEDDYDKKDNELTFAQLELKRKEELIKNLMSTVEELEGMLDSHKQIGKRISKKISLVQRPSVIKKKSSITPRPQKSEKKVVEKGENIKMYKLLF